MSRTTALATSALRWLLLAPSAIALGALASALASVFLAIGHGWAFIADLLTAPDMHDSYFSGTYSLLLIRGALAGGSTWAAHRIAPTAKLGTAYCWLGAIATGLGAYVFWINIILERAQLQFSFSAGYRILVETIGMLGGSFLMIRSLRHEGGPQVAPSHETRVLQAERHVALGQLRDAIAIYRTVLATSPADTTALIRIGDLLLRCGDLDEARTAFHQAAWLLTEAGSYDKAVEIYKKLIMVCPADLEVYELLAVLYTRMGRATDSMAQYQALLNYYHKQGNAAATSRIEREISSLKLS